MKASSIEMRAAPRMALLYACLFVVVVGVALVALHSVDPSSSSTRGGALPAIGSTPIGAVGTAPEAGATSPTTSTIRATPTAPAATPATTTPATPAATTPAVHASTPAPVAAMPITALSLPAGTTAGPTPGSFVVTVASGETLSGISAWFDTHGYGAIFAANETELGPNPNLIFPGEKIIVNPTVASMAVIPPGATAGSASGTFVVTVTKGETLSAISAWFTTRGYGAIFAANRAELGPNPNLIIPGEKIVVTPAMATMAVIPPEAP